jgi:hypothetical protein
MENLDMEKFKKLIEQRKAAVKKWQNNNKDKVAEYKKRYAQKNKVMYVRNATKSRINCPEKYKQYQSLYRATRLLRQLPYFDHEILQ